MGPPTHPPTHTHQSTPLLHGLVSGWGPSPLGGRGTGLRGSGAWSGVGEAAEHPPLGWQTPRRQTKSLRKRKSENTHF